MGINGRDVRYQNSEFRVQTAPFLSSEICILTSDIFAVEAAVE